MQPWICFYPWLTIPVLRYMWWPLYPVHHPDCQSGDSLWSFGHSCVGQRVRELNYHHRQMLHRLYSFRSCWYRDKADKNEEWYLTEYGDDRMYVFVTFQLEGDYYFTLLRSNASTVATNSTSLSTSQAVLYNYPQHFMVSHSQFMSHIFDLIYAP